MKPPNRLMGAAITLVKVPVLQQNVSPSSPRKQPGFDHFSDQSAHQWPRATDHLGEILLADFRNQDYSFRVYCPGPLRQIAQHHRETVRVRKVQQDRKEAEVLGPESVQGHEDRDQSIRGKSGQQPRDMFAVEESQRAFARSLGLEQARMTALFVDIVRIADDLPGPAIRTRVRSPSPTGQYTFTYPLKMQASMPSVLPSQNTSASFWKATAMWRAISSSTRFVGRFKRQRLARRIVRTSSG